MTRPSPGQQRAVQDLERLTQHRPDLLAIVGPPATTENPATIRIRLPTGELERRDARYGVASVCVGFGQAIAAVVERL